MNLYEIMGSLNDLKGHTESAMHNFQDLERLFLTDGNECNLYPIQMSIMVFQSQQNDLEKIIDELDKILIDLRKKETF
jgi:hypothetical protein